MGSHPSLISLMVSVDVKHHVYLLTVGSQPSHWAHSAPTPSALFRNRSGLKNLIQLPTGFEPTTFRPEVRSADHYATEADVTVPQQEKKKFGLNLLSRFTYLRKKSVTN